MFRAILGSIFEGLCGVIYKKASSMNKTTYLIHSFLGRIPDFVISIIFIAIGLVSFSIGGNFWMFIFIFGFIFIGGYMTEILNGYLYKHEKMSVLLPFENMDRLIAVIVGFLLLGNATLITFVISIFTVFVVIFLSINFKEFRISKYIFGMLIVSIVRGISLVGLGYLFVKEFLSFTEFYSYNAILFFLTSVIYVLFRGQIKELFGCEKKYYMYRLGGGFLGASSFIISLYLVQDLGVVMSSLLGLIGISVTILLSWIIMKDKPSPKDLFLTFFIIGMIVLGYTFGSN